MVDDAGVGCGGARCLRFAKSLRSGCLEFTKSLRLGSSSSRMLSKGVVKGSCEFLVVPKADGERNSSS